MTNTKTPKRPTKGEVMARLRVWQERLLLHQFAFSVEFGPDPTEERADADCAAAPEYMEAHLRFDLKAIPRARLDAYVRHELLHCYVEPLAHYAAFLCNGDKDKLEAVRHFEEELVTNFQRVTGSLAGEAE